MMNLQAPFMSGFDQFRHCELQETQQHPARIGFDPELGMLTCLHIQQGRADGWLVVSAGASTHKSGLIRGMS